MLASAAALATKVAEALPSRTVRDHRVEGLAGVPRAEQRRPQLGECPERLADRGRLVPELRFAGPGGFAIRPADEPVVSHHRVGEEHLPLDGADREDREAAVVRELAEPVGEVALPLSAQPRDLAGYDENGREHVLIEAKFAAGAQEVPAFASRLTHAGGGVEIAVWRSPTRSTTPPSSTSCRTTGRRASSSAASPGSTSSRWSCARRSWRPPATRRPVTTARRCSRPSPCSAWTSRPACAPPTAASGRCSSRSRRPTRPPSWNAFAPTWASNCAAPPT